MARRVELQQRPSQEEDACLHRAERWIVTREPELLREIDQVPWHNCTLPENVLVLAAGGGDPLAQMLLDEWGPEPYPDFRRLRLLEVFECVVQHDHALETRIHEGFRRELVPWALGYSDAVRERVSARTGGAEADT